MLKLKKYIWLLLGGCVCEQVAAMRKRETFECSASYSGDLKGNLFYSLFSLQKRRSILSRVEVFGNKLVVSSIANYREWDQERPIPQVFNVSYYHAESYSYFARYIHIAATNVTNVTNVDENIYWIKLSFEEQKSWDRLGHLLEKDFSKIETLDGFKEKFRNDFGNQKSFIPFKTYNQKQDNSKKNYSSISHPRQIDCGSNILIDKADSGQKRNIIKTQCSPPPKKKAPFRFTFFST